ncbi:MAG: UDP-N-acetylmuramoyl-L-alanyl-D-glutamate--2,6-diaminopimelate ligase [Candidatus Moraniibacteriota bacterium]
MRLKRIYQKIKNTYHLIKAVLANFYFGFPSGRIYIIGVTGTNGKTTTAQMISRILEKAGYKVAMSSTINFKIGSEEWVNKTKFTTRSAWDVQRFIKRTADEKCDYLVLEVSSHSLDQNRIWGTLVDEAVITNITREHLDYHFTMKEYEEAKARLFAMTARNEGIAVLNNNLPDIKNFVFKGMKKYYLYGIKSKKTNLENFSSELFLPEKIKVRENGSEFTLNKKDFKLSLAGEVNIENALASIAVARSQGVDFGVAAEALSEINLIPGRMERVDNKKGVEVIIDYALTPDSMEKLGESIKKSKKRGRIIWVFGSCGERDRGKRPLMGEIVSRYADVIILTNEDPYNEDPERIVKEIQEGVKNKTKGETLRVIMDRKEAIKKAASLANKNDTILITGKGAEENMMIKGKKVPWNDKRIVEEIL